MDALDLLKEDHQKVKELFEEAEGTEDQKEKDRIFTEIQSELETHSRIEETVFYPAMQEHEELKDMVLGSIEEHRQIKTLLKEIDNLKSESEKFEPKVKSADGKRRASCGRRGRGKNVSEDSGNMQSGRSRRTRSGTGGGEKPPKAKGKLIAK